MKHSTSPLKCNYCKKTSYFLIEIVKQGESNYLLSQCPNCNRYEEVKPLSNLDSKDFYKGKPNDPSEI